MKSNILRMAVPLAVVVVISAGFVLNMGVGTLSALGWGDISLLCPLGALGTMLASKTIIPRALVSLVIAAVAVLLLGRAFCGWVCPVPLVSRLRTAFSKKGAAVGKGKTTEPLSPEEEGALKGCTGGCDSCSATRREFDTRHFVLGGSLLSAAIFGFPVFCLICPIGLVFATVLLVMLLFSGGDVTWSVVVVPALLVVEVVFFRKWCSKICPLSAFMSLIAKGNRMFRPTVDESRCLESTRGACCGICFSVCGQGIDPRHPERGASWNECTKCRACVDSCPVGAIGMPFVSRKKNQAELNEGRPLD